MGWDRFDPGSTYQQWGSENGFSAPLFIDNEFGEPDLTAEGFVEVVGTGPFGEENKPFWHCDAEEGIITILVPNSPHENMIKKILLQVTSTRAPEVAVVGGPGPGYSSGTFETGLGDVQHLHGPGFHGSGPWYTYSYGLTIEPNPERETITMTFNQCTYIEQIDIDTICIPEPTAVALLGLGALGLFLRRMRR